MPNPGPPDRAARSRSRRFAVLLVVGTLLGGLAGCSPRFDWRVAAPDGGGYRVVLPGRPQTVGRALDFDGSKLEMQMTSAGAGPALFAVGAATLPSEIARDPVRRQALFDWLRGGLLRNIDGRDPARSAALLRVPGGHQLRAAESVRAEGHFGPERRNALLAARFYVVDDRLFQVVALGAPADLSADVLDTFFASFEVLP